MGPITKVPIHGVIFDLDGTLLETEGPATQALQMAVDKFGKKVTWEVKQKLLGLRPVEWAPLVIRVLEVEGLITPTELQETWEKSMHELMQAVQKCPGAEKTTSTLKEMGIPQSIATSSTKIGVAAKRPHHEEMFGRMKHVITGDDPEVHDGKPAPDIYLVAAKRMGLDPKSCLVFEDALLGLKAAKAAGMFVVSIPDTRLGTAPFVDAGADVVLKSMEEWDPSAWPLKALDKTKQEETPTTATLSDEDFNPHRVSQETSTTAGASDKM